MSASVRAYVAKHSKLTRSAKNVLLQIAHYADDDGGNAFSSVATLVEDTGWSESTVHRALRAAQEQGELDIRVGFGPAGTNLYTIKLQNIGSPEDRQRHGYSNLTPGANLTPEGSSLRERQLPCRGNNKESSLRERQSPTRSNNDHGTHFRSEKSSAPESKLKFVQNAAPAPRVHINPDDVDHELDASFDVAMRDTLGAGKPGPAQVASEQALRRALATYQGRAEPLPFEEERAARERALFEWDEHEERLRSRLNSRAQAGGAEPAQTRLSGQPDVARELLREPASERVSTHSERISERKA